MPPTDLTTINDPRLYMIGAGIVEIDVFDPVTGLPTGYRDMGNATVVEPSNNDERFKKFESRTRYRAVVADLLLRRNTDITFNFDEWSDRLIRMYFQATQEQSAAQVATPVVGETVTTAVVLGSSYRLAKLGPISAYSFVETYGMTTLVEGTDFIIDDVNVPIVRFLADAPNLTDGDEIEGSYTPTAYAGGATQWNIGQVSTVRGAIRFIGDPVNGPRLLFDYWRASFRPNGALPLITTGNENTPISIIASIESDTVNHPENPIGRILQLNA